MQNTASEIEEYGVDLRTMPVSKFDYIHFVELVERAYQYIELKRRFDLDILMPGVSLPKSVRTHIFEVARKDQSFNKLIEEDILDNLETSVHEIRHRREPHKYPSPENFWKILYSVSRTSIYGVVRKAVEKGLVLDRDPEVEIKKLKSASLRSYYVDFVCEEKMHRSNTVTFVVPYGTSTEDVKTSLTSTASTEENAICAFGPVKIISCHITSSGEQSAMALVTFKDEDDAYTTTLLAAHGQLKLCGEEAKFILTPYNVLPENVNLPQDDLVKSAMDAYDKVEEELLVDALSRYPKLLEKVEREMTDPNKRRESERECAELKNGGLTKTVELEELLFENGSCVTNPWSSEVEVSW